MDVDEIGAELARRPCYLGGLDPASEHRRARPQPAAEAVELAAVALQQPHFMPAVAQQLLELRGGALLASLGAVAVVQDQHPRQAALGHAIRVWRASTDSAST